MRLLSLIGVVICVGGTGLCTASGQAGERVNLLLPSRSLLARSAKLCPQQRASKTYTKDISKAENGWYAFLSGLERQVRKSQLFTRLESVR